MKVTIVKGPYYEQQLQKAYALLYQIIKKKAQLIQERMDLGKKQPSPEVMRQIYKLLLKTSVPKILEEQRKIKEIEKK